HSPTSLVCLFFVTSGQNGENLGSDEEQIVLFVHMIYDLKENKVCIQLFLYIIQQHESIITEECRIQTGVSEEAILNAPPLGHVIDEFENSLSSHQLHNLSGLTRQNFCLCTDGQLHLRMCLLPECSNKNINLAHHYFRFFDLRKEFRKCYKYEDDVAVHCLADMLELSGLEKVDEPQYGMRQCKEMALIIHKMVAQGHLFLESEYIKDKLEPGVCGKDEVVDDDTVVRARGLPWQSSDQDIARFFRGLNVEKGGVALCLSPQGRRNGEALIRFESKEHRDLALRKHKHHIGQRYIEVYKASGEDFIAVAGGTLTEAQEFLSRHGDGGSQIIVRMRGLPYICKAEQVLNFFKQEPNPADVLDGEDGVLFVHQADGRSTGDAFVLFSSESEADLALSKHRQCIGTRYIELFKSTTAEVQQVDITTLEHFPQIITFPAAIHPANSFLLQPTSHQQIITSGTKRDCLRIRGLPTDAHVSDVLTFLGENSKYIVYQGVHMVYNSRGMPSGEAFIQMDGEQSAEITSLAKNKKVMYTQGGRKNYIEVIQCSGDEMNLLLNSG
ncbi:hypothetical protein HELRODRAFT_139357, partial [Helobdella robusta]|uniref:RRM domain-containing protein n=1 Tax=Helobdella robusta TaxID=6412 RepID=T1EIY5_HELRO